MKGDIVRRGVARVSGNKTKQNKIFSGIRQNKERNKECSEEAIHIFPKRTRLD